MTEERNVEVEDAEVVAEEEARPEPDNPLTQIVHLNREIDRALDESIRETENQLRENPDNEVMARKLGKLRAEKERKAKSREFEERTLEIQRLTMEMWEATGGVKPETITPEMRDKVLEIANASRALYLDRGLYGISIGEMRDLAEAATLTEEDVGKMSVGTRNSLYGSMMRKMKLTKRFKFVSPQSLLPRMRRRGREWAFYRFAAMINKVKLSKLQPRFATINRLLVLSAYEDSLPAAVLDREDEQEREGAALALDVFGSRHLINEERARRKEAEGRSALAAAEAVEENDDGEEDDAG